MAWYHCGRCGTLFKSPAGDPNDRRCSHCGQDPSLGLPAVSTRPGTHPATQHPIVLPTRTGASKARKKSDSRHPKRNSLIAKILLGWLLTTALIALLIRWLWPEVTGSNASEAARFSVQGTAGDEAVVMIQKALVPCGAVLGGFLNAGTPEERNQFVLNPVTTAGRMARFYDLNPLTRINPKNVNNTVNTMLNLPDGQALESRWITTDGRSFDCVFVKQNGEWRLDWEHFSRYCEYPWSLFLSGSGAQEVEFRLLVRERLAKEHSESSYMSLAFYAPRFGSPGQVGVASPEFVIKRDSDDGRLLAAAFKIREKGETLYGSKLPAMDPDGMIRVRVKMRRLQSDPDATPKFELAKVITCHWLATDDPGLQPLDLNSK